jgi:hypothetical protein
VEVIILGPFSACKIIHIFWSSKGGTLVGMRTNLGKFNFEAGLSVGIVFPNENFLQFQRYLRQGKWRIISKANLEPAWA